MIYGDFKDLEIRTVSEKVLNDKAFNIAKKPKYEGYQRSLASVVQNPLNKITASHKDKFLAGSGIKIKLAEELH